MTGGHNAVPVGAMAQAESVPELMIGFLREAFAQKLGALRLCEAMVRHNGAVTAELRFSEHKGQDRDEKVNRADPEHARGGLRLQTREALENGGGVILSAPGIERKHRIEPFLFDVAGDLECAGNVRREITEQIIIGRFRSYADDVYGCVYASVARYLLSL